MRRIKILVLLVLVALLFGFASEVTVRFDANGGKGTMADVVVQRGDPLKLPANNFSRPNFIFKGWSTTARGSVVYADRANCTMGGSVVTLYAVWDTKWKTYGTNPTFKMRYVPVSTRGITFPSKENDSETLTVGKSFWVAETEVIWALWNKVRQWNLENSQGYDFGLGQMGGWDTSAYNNNPCNGNHPVTMVSLRDAIVFCNALTEWVNDTQNPAIPLEPVYYSDATYHNLIKVTDTGSTLHEKAGEIDYPYIKADKNGNTNMVNCSATGFRLPTRGEWECMARWQGTKNLNGNFVNPMRASCTAGYYWTKGNSASGSTTAYKGSDTKNVAVYDTNSSKKTAVVKSKKANSLGLYDVSGNVWEWSSDWSPQVSSSRVVHGGGWGGYSLGLQISYVNSSAPYGRYNCYGLRVFRSM